MSISRLLNGCKDGETKITKGYNLKAKYVIHTVTPNDMCHDIFRNSMIVQDIKNVF